MPALTGRLVGSVLIGAALVLPARAYDLQHRQNGTSFVIEPLPRSAAQWQQLLSVLAARYARLMLENGSWILSQP